MSAAVDAGLLDQRVDELISAQVRRTPHAPAAVCGSRSMSYLELERQSGRVADRLRALGVARGSLVGIHRERSLEMLVAVIAVMKAGGAYVPLDPEFPPDRLAYMVADAGLSWVITQPSLASSAPPGDYRKITIEQLIAADGGMPDATLSPARAGGGDLIYVLYTSGSTGMPKGVALEHRNIVNFLLSMQQEPGMTEQDRIVAVTTLSFDIAGLELYLPLIAGATVVIASPDEAADGESLRTLIETHRATVMQATPTTWRLLIEAGWQGSRDFKILCGGETLPQDLARQLARRCGELWNMYGPTETAVWSTVYRVGEGGAPVLIGRPIANTRIYVLDKSGRPVPTGVPGEIYIAGAGVARGYLGRPELTAQRFLRDPFSEAHGGTMYRTGDWGRYLVDGNLEFRNRADNQVKIRGFRVELNEVEAAMASHPGVRQAIAKTFEIRPGDLRLVGYLLPDGDAPTATEFRDYLRARLPHYMVPQHFSIVGEFPLMPNGKVDRARLPAPQADDLMAEPHVEPKNPGERAVAQVFCDVLGVERVSADASFFDLGGHSVLATMAVALLRRRGHAGITLRMLFESPTAVALSREIEQLRQSHDAQASSEREVFQF